MQTVNSSCGSSQICTNHLSQSSKQIIWWCEKYRYQTSIKLNSSLYIMIPWTPLLQLFIFNCFNHWDPQQLGASQYVHSILISMLMRQICEGRQTASKDTDMVKYFQSENNNQHWLCSNIQKVTKNLLKFLFITLLFSLWYTYSNKVFLVVGLVVR